jgi:hypothetical protein
MICQYVQWCVVLFKNMPQFLFFFGSDIAVTDFGRSIIKFILHKNHRFLLCQQISTQNSGHSIQSSSSIKMSLLI